jgi:hypothetical protein
MRKNLVEAIAGRSEIGIGRKCGKGDENARVLKK